MKKKSDYSELIKNVTNKLQTSKGNMLSFSGTYMVENYYDVPTISKKILNIDKIKMRFLRMIHLQNRVIAVTCSNHNTFYWKKDNVHIVFAEVSSKSLITMPHSVILRCTIVIVVEKNYG